VAARLQVFEENPREIMDPTVERDKRYIRDKERKSVEV
jgi:hypothetical protein